MRRFLLLGLGFCLAVLTGHAQLTPPAGVDIDWYVGNESALSFTIFEPAELAGVSWLVQYDHTHFDNQTIFLGKDIELGAWMESYGANTLSSSGWIPIGISGELSFNGSFIGNGYTVSGLWIEAPTIYYGGLFGCITQTGNISNLTVEVAERGVSGDGYVGGLAGFNEGTIVNCAVKSNASGTTLKRLQNWKIPEIQTFQGFFFSSKSHFFGKIRRFPRANSCTFLVAKKLSTNCALSHWLSYR